jgi:hypothetical protein
MKKKRKNILKLITQNSIIFIYQLIPCSDCCVAVLIVRMSNPPKPNSNCIHFADDGSATGALRLPQFSHKAWHSVLPAGDEEGGWPGGQPFGNLLEDAEQTQGSGLSENNGKGMRKHVMKMKKNLPLPAVDVQGEPVEGRT